MLWTNRSSRIDSRPLEVGIVRYQLFPLIWIRYETPLQCLTQKKKLALCELPAPFSLLSSSPPYKISPATRRPLYLLLRNHGSRGKTLRGAAATLSIRALFINVYCCSIKSGPFTGKMDGSDCVQSLRSDCILSAWSGAIPAVHKECNN